MDIRRLLNNEMSSSQIQAEESYGKIFSRKIKVDEASTSEDEGEESVFEKNKPYLDAEGYWHKKVPITDDDTYITEMDLTDTQKIRFYGQLEAASGCLYQLFLGENNSPITKFDSSKEEVLSKDIPGLMIWNEIYDADENTILESPFDTNGKIYVNNSLKTVTHLEAIGVVAWFLGEIDMHGDNFGLVELLEKLRGFKFDHGKTFAAIDSPLVFSDIYKIFSAAKEHYKIGFCYTSFPKEITDHPKSLEKRLKMVSIICNTPFEQIERCLQKNISDEFKDETKLLVEFLKERHEALKLGYAEHRSFDGKAKQPPITSSNFFAAKRQKVVSSDDMPKPEKDERRTQQKN